MLKNINLRKNIKQASSLYGAMLFGLLLGFAISMLNTRFLTVEDYGKLKFIQQLFALTATVSAFGLSYSASRLITQSNRATSCEIIGATVTIYAVISFLSACIIFLLSSFIDELFNADIAIYLRQAALLIFSSIFTLVLDNLFRGANRIYSLALFHILPKFFYLLMGIFFILYLNHFNLMTALLLNFSIAGITTIAMIMTLRPKFTLNNIINDIWNENRNNGFHVYIGSLANVAAAQLIAIVLGYYADMASVGYYSLAVILTAPLQFLPSVIGTTLFKSFAILPSIPSVVMWGALLPTAGALIFFWLIIDNVLVYIYSKQYLPVVQFAKILSIGMALHGVGDLFNRFLGAHAKGRELRNAAFSSGGYLLIGCFFVLPFYGAIGGAIIKASSSFIYFLITFIYYKKFAKADL